MDAHELGHSTGNTRAKLEHYVSVSSQIHPQPLLETMSATVWPLVRGPARHKPAQVEQIA